MSIAEELVKCFPEHWEADIYTHEIYLMPGSDAPFSSIAIDGKNESPGFINWALDELAKADGVVVVDLGWTDFGWTVTLVFTPSDERDTLTITPKESKTLALAHARIALGEHDG